MKRFEKKYNSGIPNAKKANTLPNLALFVYLIISSIKKHQKLSIALACLVFVSLLSITTVGKLFNSNGSVKNVSFVNLPIAVTDSKLNNLSVPTGIVKANPFVPYREITTRNRSEVPSYTLVEPPEFVSQNSDAARVMDTTVSGILYDKFSPSAILNIEGNDYLVKKGDTVNNYKVLNITPSTVTVRLNSNVYTAGIGEILTEGTVNNNDIANLKNKFGGRK